MPITRVSAAEARRLATKAAQDVDWARIDAMSDGDIARQAADDPDAAPILPDGELGRMLADGRAWITRPPSKVNVKAIRRRLKLSQVQFAGRFGLSVASVRDWEQGRRQPEGPTRAYLQVIAREPAAVIRALAATE